MTDKAEPKHEPRNIVICCDGTGNEISENISNVLKLYRCLRKTGKTEPHQVVFYDPGVGTLARPNPWRKLRQDSSRSSGLPPATASTTTCSLYEFLVHNYGEGDDIFLFGFSRGAYTVRVLAGLIHKVGLVSPEQSNLAGSGLTAYKQFFSDGQRRSKSAIRAAGTADAGSDGEGRCPSDKDDQAAQFARILSARWPTIKFVGVWDTVASVIVPRPDRLYWPSLEELALHRKSERKDISPGDLDRRAAPNVRLKPWDQPQTFMPNRFSETNNAKPQDILQVWFAGVHADIGGGYPEKERGLSKYPLIWMIEEAKEMRAHSRPADRQPN